MNKEFLEKGMFDMDKSNKTIKNVNVIDVFEKANTLFLKEQKELIL